MTSRFPPQQKRGRWPETGAEYSPALLEQAAALSGDSAAAAPHRQLAAQLAALAGLRSTYRETQALPGLCALVTKAALDGPADERPLDLLAALLLQRNSKRLHKPLLNCLRQLRPEQADRFVALVERRVAACVAEEQALSDPASKSGVVLTEALLSLLEHPQWGKRFGGCALPALQLLARRAAAIAAAQPGGSGSSSDADHSQDVISCIYTLLQLHSSKLAAQHPAETAAAAAGVGQAMLRVLQGGLLLRDGLKSAAVTLWACARLPAVPAEALALQLAGALLCAGGGSVRLQQAAAEPGAGAAEAGWLERRLSSEGASLQAELGRLPPLARACAIAGLLAVLPPEALNARLALRQHADSAAEPQPSSTDPAQQRQSHSDSPAGRQQASAAAAAEAQQPSVAPAEAWDLLVCGALPTACGLAEAATDDFVRQQALGALTVALQRTAARLQGCEAGLAAERGWTVGPELRSRLMACLQSSWEVPSLQCLRQLHAAFEALLDLLQWQMAQPGLPAHQAAEAEAYLREVARSMLALDPQRSRGVLAPLKAVAARLGSGWLLGVEPGLVAAALGSMQEDAACQAGTALLEELLRRLLAEAHAAGGSAAEADAAWRGHWQPPLLAALRNGDERLRANLAAHVLPMLLRLQPAALPLLLAASLGGDREAAALEDCDVAAVVAILRAGRQLGLVEQLDSVAVPGTAEAEAVAVPPELLLRAVRHRSEGLRTEALALLSGHPKLTRLPSELELRLAAEALALSLRGQSASMRNKWAGLTARLVARVIASLRTAVSKGGPEAAEGAARQAAFLRSLTAGLAASLYPGAPFGRKHPAALLLARLLELWGTEGDWTPARGAAREAQRSGGRGAGALPLSIGGLQALPQGLFSAPATAALLEAMVDTWDRTREALAAVLTAWPAPLPGLETQAQLAGFLGWCRRLTACPRLPESDAGARLLRLAFSKYAATLAALLPWDGTEAAGWQPDAPPAQAAGPAEACLDFLQHLSAELKASIDEAAAGLAAGSRGGGLHGCLLALRYCTEEAPWEQLAAAAQAQPGFAAAAQCWLRTLVCQLGSVAQIALPVLALHEDATVGAEEVTGEDWGAADGSFEADAEQAAAPAGQLVTTACWLALKEVGLVVGALARRLPPSGSGSGALTDSAALAAAGDLLLDCLLQAKHNGAVEKCVLGLTALTERLLGEGDQARPQAWIDRLLAFACRPGQALSDINRRSAGLPFALAAVLLAEPAGGHRQLLRHAVARLLAIAAGSTPAGGSGGEQRQQQQPYPRVHAFNALRFLFKDRLLGGELAGSLADGMRLALEALDAPHWEERNAASLCFAALCVRALGFANAPGAKAAASSAQFFARLPALHGLIRRQLAGAAEAMRGGGGAPPALFPALALLARMRAPQWPLEGAAAAHDPALLLPEVQRCCGLPPMAVRQVAAKAVAALLPPAAAQAQLGALLAAVRRPGLPHNQAHGALLQIRALLASLAEAGRLSPPLAAAARDAACVPCEACPALAAERLELGRQLLACQPSQAAAAQLRQAAAAALAAPSIAASSVAAGLRSAAMRPVLVETAVAALLESRAADGQEQGEGSSSDALLSGLLGASDGEVRLAGLRALLQAAEAGKLPSHASLRSALQRCAAAAGSSAEEQRLAQCLLAQLPATEAPEAASGSGGSLAPEGQSVQREWQSLRRLHAEARSPAAREGVLASMGALQRRAAAAGSDSLAAAFLEVVQEAAAPAELPSTRLAAQAALHASGLLAAAPGNPAASVPAWAAMLALTEDEDAGVRAAAAASLGSSLPAIYGKACGEAAVARVQQQAFAALTAAFGADAAYLRLLLRLLGGGGAGAQQQQGGANLLFAKEKDNQHEEPLLCAQHAALQLRQLLVSGPLPPALASETAAWLLQLLQDAVEALDSCAGGQGGLGGPSYTPATFLQLQCCLLALLAAAGTGLPADGPAISSSLARLATLLRQRPPLHPLTEAALRDAEAAWPPDAPAAREAGAGLAVLRRHLLLLPPEP